MTNVAKEELRQIWETRIADFKTSGLSGTAWCAASGLRPIDTEHMFAYNNNRDCQTKK